MGIPYRVGDKFGVSDAKGKMLIPAKYDIVEPEIYNDYKYLTAYILTGNGVLSSLIYNNKVVLKDKNYDSYYIDNGLIKAIYYTIKKQSGYFDDNFTATYHLYDIKGKDVFKEDFRDIGLYDEIDESGKLEVFLIYTEDLEGKNSLYLYDKKAKKITKTLIDKALWMLTDYNWNYNYRDRRITVTYTDKNRANKKMVLIQQGNTIAIESDTVTDPPEKTDAWEDIYEGDLVAEPMRTEPVLNTTEEKIVLSARKAERKRGLYYMPKKIEEVKMTYITLQKDQQFIVSKNNRQGLFSGYRNEYIIPAEYDEIIFAEFDGRNGGHILRNGDKYGVFTYDYPDNKTIAPVFNMLPLLVDYNYLDERKPLFKLYDKNGKLFCYADETGKLFYSP